MRICFFGHKRIPSREGGVEIVVEELAVRMAALGHDVTCLNRRRSKHADMRKRADLEADADNREREQKRKGAHVGECEVSRSERLRKREGADVNMCAVRGVERKQKREDAHVSRRGMYKGVRIKTVPTIDRRGLAAVTASFFATLAASFGRFDVVHIHAEGSAFMCALPKLMGKRVIVTIHGLDHRRAKWGRFASAFIMMGEKSAVRHADEIIVLSRGVQDYFKKTYGRETVLIPNGVSRPQKCDADIIKKRFGLENESYILYLGRLVPEKGVHHLIQAYRRLELSGESESAGYTSCTMHTEPTASACRDARLDRNVGDRILPKLVIAGGSSDTDEYERSLRELAADDDNIIFAGFVKGRILEELYSNAYLYVLPSELEGMPLSLLEAMSYGNCCLTSDIAENADVVGEHGVTFRTNDEDDLAEKLGELLNNSDMVSAYKGEAADYICTRYNWDDVTERTLRVYAEGSRRLLN